MDRIDPTQLQKMLNSEDGKKLLTLLKKDGGAAFSKAADAARSGNYSLAMSILAPVLSGTEAEKLARSMGEVNG